jgi:putative hydrolase of the HAD superfamily
MSHNIRAVVFDAVGTLIHAEPSVGKVYAAIGRRYGCQLADADMETRFRIAFRRQERIDLDRQWTTSEAREERRWRDIVAEVFGANDGAFAELYQHFAEPMAWRVDAAAAPLIASLRRRGMLVAMASNFDGRLHGVVAGLRPLAELDAVIVSSEIGVRKPGRSFFEAIEKRLGVRAAQIAFIGDDPVNDGQGAAEAGMRTLLLGRDVRDMADIEKRLHPWLE